MIKKQIALLILLITTLNISFSEEPETLNRNNITHEQQDYFLYIQKNEKHFLEVMKTTKNLQKKAEATALLGLLYSFKREFLKAERFLKLVADSNQYEKSNQLVSIARYNLAMIYVHGKGKIKKDLNKAFHYFSKAAEAGNKQAMAEVFIMCHKKEVSANLIHNFTKKNYNIYIQGENHPDYLIALKNLRALSQCESEGDYLKSLEN